MQDLLQYVIDEVRGMWRFRWLAMAIAWPVCVIGWLYVYSMPNIYEASAQVYVDADSRLVDVMGEVGVAPTPGATIFVVGRAMLGRPQLENVASDTGLEKRAENDEEYDRLIVGLQEKISITAGRSTDSRNLYTITYADRDRKMAVDVVTALLDRFVTDVLSRNDQGSQQATGYLDEQLTYYGNALSEVEQKLANFKKENIGLLPGDSGGIFEKLQEEIDLLEQLELDLSIEQDRREALRAQLRSENPMLPERVMIVGGTEITGSPTENSIRQLESNRATLLLSFTDKHPDIVAIDEQLEQLYEKRRAEIAAFTAENDGIEGAANANNPVYQSVQIELNKSSIRIASLQSEISQHKAVVRDLNGKIHTIPDVEARYAKLNRDYDQFQALYDQLLVQKERERMGEAGEDREVVSFNIIEPPSAPIEPVSPPRLVLHLLVLMFGMGAGVGVVYLKHVGHPVFHDGNSLRVFSGRPVLGSISMCWIEEHRKQQLIGLAAFSGAAVFLALVFVLSIAFQDAGIAAMQSLFASS